MCIQKTKDKKKNQTARRAVALVTLAAVGILAKGALTCLSRAWAAGIQGLGCSALLRVLLTHQHVFLWLCALKFQSAVYNSSPDDQKGKNIINTPKMQPITICSLPAQNLETELRSVLLLTDPVQRHLEGFGRKEEEAAPVAVTTQTDGSAGIRKFLGFKA